MAKPLSLTDSTFDSTIANGVTLVDFWAPWCGPCKMIAPVLDDIASHYGGKVKVTKMNVDENFEISQRFGITSIPTLLFFNNGAIVDHIIGAVSKNQLETRINRLLNFPAIG